MPNCATLWIGSGTCSGPAEAKPTKTAMSMRGNGSSTAAGTTSNSMPGKRRVLITAGSLHFQALVGDYQFFHCDIGALGVEGAARVLGDARPEKLPRLHEVGVILVLQLDRHRAQGLLVAVANLVQPLVKIERADNTALHRHVSGFVQPVDLHHAILA